MATNLQWPRFHVLSQKLPCFVFWQLSQSTVVSWRDLLMKTPFLLLLPVSILLFGCEKPSPVSGVSATDASAPTPAEKVASPIAPAQSSGADSRPAGGSPGGSGGGDRGQRMEQMLATLNLDADQMQKVRAAVGGQRPAMEAIRNDTSLSREQRREKMQALRQELDSQMSVILTPEQKLKWDQERAQRRERIGQGGRNNPSSSPAGTNSAP